MNSALQNGLNTVTNTGLSAIGASVFNNASGSFFGPKPQYDNSGQLTGYTTVSSNNNLSLPDDIFTKIKEGLNGALSAASGNIPGAIANIFSAVIGGSSAGQQTVSLTLNAKLQLDGTLSSYGSFPASPTSVYLPGTQINTTLAQNYVPAYNQTLGVFNLSAKPKINVTTIASTNYAIHGTNYDNTFAVDKSYLNTIIQWNPSIFNNLATYQNFLTEVVLFENPYYTQIWGNKETIGSYNVYTGGTVNTLFSDAEDNSGNNLFYYKAAVRISFDVVPNNGGPKSRIIKTFLADLIY
jgi:hypothetical protein